MDLNEYLVSRQISKQEFADMIKVTRSAVSHYCHKKRIPTLLIAMKIKEATNGKVTLQDLVPNK